MVLRSPGSRLSRRAASSAWIEAGRGAAPSTPSCPRSSATAASCSAKRGLPSAVAAINRRDFRVLDAELSEQLVGLGVRELRELDERYRGHPGRARGGRDARCRGSQSGRWPKATMYSTRSSIVGSAQWMSSRHTSRGRSRARLSSTRRMPQKSSSLGAGRSDSPIGAAQPLECPRASTSSSPTAARNASSPPRSRTISTSGQYVIPAPYARQRPETTRAVRSRPGDDLAARAATCRPLRARGASGRRTGRRRGARCIAVTQLGELALAARRGARRDAARTPPRSRRRRRGASGRPGRASPSR